MSDKATITSTAQDVSRSSLGVVYIAFGVDYLAMALNSVSSLRGVGCALPVRVVTNVRPRSGGSGLQGTSGVSFHFVAAPRSSNRWVKTSQHDFSPFVTTLYVDCDTEFLEDPEASLRSLDGIDLAMRKHVQPLPPRSPKGRLKVYDGTPAARMPHWNSSVIVYRRTRAVEEFFAFWHAAFIRQGVRYDQISLVEAALAAGPVLHSVDGFDFIQHYASRMPSSVAASCRAISRELFRGLDRVVALVGIARRRRQLNRLTRLLLTVPVWAAWNLVLRLESLREQVRSTATSDALAAGGRVDP